MIDVSKSFGGLFFGNNEGTELRKKSVRGGEEFARLNPSDIDSVISAAKYVGATESELSEIKSYFEKNYE